MKAGDLVVRVGSHNDSEYGRGVVLDSYESDVGVPYVEVYWPDLSERLWYDEIELRVVSESR